MLHTMRALHSETDYASQPTVSCFAKGQRVFHQKFGYGIITAIEGDHLTVAFKHAGIKKVMADYVNPA